MESAERAITDRFAFETRIGSGSFGEVFRGVDRETGALVAIKRLLAQTSDPIAAQRFHQEARLLARVRSPHVVGYVAHGHDHEGRLCLVLEWLQGQDLSRRQRAAPLTLTELLEAASQAAEGLGALHDAGIVHRDVKPSNFFLVDRPDGTLHLKLIDLGIARSLTDDAITLEGFRVGTPAYMSPEQARGEADITAHTDVYSLGVVLFELIAKRRPFTGRDPFAVLAQIVLQVPPRLAELVPAVPPLLDDIVHRAMQRDPSARFPDARAFAAAIRRVEATSGATGGVGEEMATMAVHPVLAVATAEQRVVTALFAGFRGVPAESDAFARFESIVVSHGGVAHRTLGRRAVAVFGIERSSGDEALRAARAALESATNVKGSRVALSTCRVLTNAAGLSAEAIERGATQIEKPGDGIRVDAATARMIESQFRIEAIDGDALLRGERPTLDDTGPMLFGRETPLVGRERELAMLDACFAESSSEQVARSVLLVGAAGSGKSRIRFEWVKKLRARESALIVLHGRGDPVTARSPFGVLARALRSHAGIVDGDPIERRREKLSNVLLRAVRASDRERVGPFLGELAGVPFDDSGDDALRAARADPMLRGDSMRAAFESWLVSECEDGPVMIVLEDVQWVDVPSLKAIDSALRNLADRPLLLLSIGRHENREAFRTALPNASQEVVVSPLSKKSALRLVREVLGESAPEAQVERLVERAEGNPFHLEELMRAVIAGQGEELPDTVLGMVQARLDALGPEAKRVLRVASVFGQTFWRGGVVSLGGVERTQSTEEWLNELVQREIVTQRGTSAVRGEVEFVFRNMLLRDAAYAMLTDEDRVHAHGLAAQWLEAAGTLDAAALADHFERGQLSIRAIDWYVVAADAALAGNDFAAAVKAATRAVECGAAGTQAGRALVIQAEAHRWRGELEECLRYAGAATEKLAEGSVLWYRAIGEVLTASIRTGRMDEAHAWIERWRSAKPEVDARSAAVATGGRIVAVMFTAGEALVSEGILDEVRRLAEGAVLEPSARARLAQGEAQARLTAADHAGSLRAVETSVREFQQAGDERNVSFQRVNIANLLIELGRYTDAERELRGVLASSQRMGLKSLNAFAKHNLGRVLGFRGDNVTGIAVERQAVEWFQAQGDPRMEAITLVYVSEMLTRLGQLGDAERDARTAFDMAIASAPVVYVQAAAQLAIVMLAKGEAEDALSIARQGLVRLEELVRVEEGEGQLRLVLAESLYAVGRVEEAHEAIAEARRQLEERASKVTDGALRESFRTNISHHRRTLELATEWLGETS